MSTPDTAPVRRIDQAFLARTKDIAGFRATHGHLPSGRAKDDRERILGRWLNNLRTTHRGNTGKGPTLNPVRVQLLDELLPGWSDALPGNVADDSTFLERLEKVAAFKVENGRLPASSSKECDGLGAWLTRVKSAAIGKGNMAWNPAREALVRQHLPGWLAGEEK